MRHSRFGYERTPALSSYFLREFPPGQRILNEYCVPVDGILWFSLCRLQNSRFHNVIHGTGLSRYIIGVCNSVSKASIQSFSRESEHSRNPILGFHCGMSYNSTTVILCGTISVVCSNQTPGSGDHISPESAIVPLSDLRMPSLHPGSR